MSQITITLLIGVAAVLCVAFAALRRFSVLRMRSIRFEGRAPAASGDVVGRHEKSWIGKDPDPD